MSVSSESSTVDRAGPIDHDVRVSAPPPAGDRRRLTEPGPSAILSERIRSALAEAVGRSARTLAEGTGKTLGEVRGQISPIVDLIPDLVAGRPIDESVVSMRFNVPRRYIDVLRSEFLETLRQGQTAPDGREMVAVVSAFEEAIRLGEMTSTGKFVARLAGVDSVNAVVEIAHDIRSPLSSILILVDTIRRGQSGKVSPVQERQLGLVYGAALGLSALSSDLIDAVRGERLVDGRPVPFSITETIQSVCAIVQPIGEEKGLPLHVTFPRVDGRCGYPSAINRVLLNLTTNALRYTDAGSVAIGCDEMSEELVEFWVRDTGRGIPDSVLAMLFDGFRPGSVGIRFSSAGLGLAICRTLLEAMGSALRVETAPEQGTRFSFQLTLPVV